MSSSTDAVKGYARKLHDQAHKLRRNNDVISANDIEKLGRDLISGKMTIPAVERAVQRMKDARPDLRSSDYDLLPD